MLVIFEPGDCILVLNLYSQPFYHTNIYGSMEIRKRILAIQLSTKVSKPNFCKSCGISFRRFENVIYGRQKACEDILLPIASSYPLFAYWLISNKTEPKNGHIKPDEEFIQKALEVK